MFKPTKYIKDESFDPIYKTVNPGFYFQTRLLPIALVLFGVFILGSQVVMPLVFFKTQDHIAKPVSSTILGITSGFRDFEFSELGNSDSLSEQETPEFFYITIPKLKIENALVETNSPSLNPNDALGHYKGSGIPGNAGNAFIYGHSVLPFFYNPNNYKTIFSTLNDLNQEDEFTVNYGGEDFTYKVVSKELLLPENVNPLSTFQPEYLNESTIELMTCWPAGTKSKRLIVRAVKID